MRYISQYTSVIKETKKTGLKKPALKNNDIGLYRIDISKKKKKCFNILRYDRRKSYTFTLYNA